MHPVRGVPEVVTRDLRTEAVRRFALDELMFSDGARLLSEDLVLEVAGSEGDVASVKWSAVARGTDRLSIRLRANRFAWRAATPLRDGIVQTNSYGGSPSTDWSSLASYLSPVAGVGLWRQTRRSGLPPRRDAPLAGNGRRREALPAGCPAKRRGLQTRGVPG
jgi:hypothetical protein